MITPSLKYVGCKQSLVFRLKNVERVLISSSSAIILQYAVLFLLGLFVLVHRE